MRHPAIGSAPHAVRSQPLLLPVLLVGAVLAQGCTETQAPAPERPTSVAPAFAFGGAIGDVLPGTDAVEFAEAADAFGDVEDISDGLGPTFNEASCGACHTTPVMGGSGAQIERRFGRFENNVFYAYDDANRTDNMGGTLRQLFANADYNFNGQSCNVPLEYEPVDATVKNVGRRTTPLFGLGLVEAMPDFYFSLLAATQPKSIRGVVQHVSVVLPDPRDPTQYVGSKRVGRFGWKGQVPTLLVFAGDAYDNEMGITTQSCFRGKSIVAFAEENYPNNAHSAAGCNGGDLAPAHPAHPDVPEFADDVVGPCLNGLTAIQEDLQLFATFMERLAPPPTNITEPIAFALGGVAFVKAGCSGCHVATPFVTPPHPYNGVPGNYPFRPFSDFLAHDMGSLGDQIGGSGDSPATTRLMRTAPLWGARFNTSYLHDGRAPNIESAIQAHDGQGAAARDAFNRLTGFERQNLIKFVLSL